MNLQVVKPDPLRVLESTLPVVRAAAHVMIDRAGIEAVANQIAARRAPPPDWQDSPHFYDGTWRTAGWVLALNALNFCFWSESPDPSRRWRVEYDGQLYDGYWALAAALRRAVDEGVELWSPTQLAAMTLEEVAHLLRPAHESNAPIPLLDARAKNLRELGKGLQRLAGSDQPSERAVESLVEAAGRSAARLVELVVSQFSSFNDVVWLEGREVRFYKRAQILAADLAGAFAGEGLGQFDDLDVLTAFADYKVPQVLRRFGALSYSKSLAETIAARRLIPAGSHEEVEIRAATVWACELLRQELEARRSPLRAFEIDWALWQAGQSLPAGTEPYHRTLTVFY